MGVTYLCSIDASSPWSACAATTLTDAFPLLCWRMLCRPCWSSPADASSMLRCFFWWILGHPLVVFVVSVGALGDVVLHVGSSVLGRVVGLGEVFFLFCGRRSASSVAVCLRWPCFSFFLCCQSFACLCRSTPVWLASSYVCNLLSS